MPWTRVRSHRTSAAFAPAGLALQVATTYVTSVRAYNALGMVTDASSNGMTVLAAAGAGPELPAAVAILPVPGTPNAGRDMVRL